MSVAGQPEKIPVRSQCPVIPTYRTLAQTFPFKSLILLCTKIEGARILICVPYAVEHASEALKGMSWGDLIFDQIEMPAAGCSRHVWPKQVPDCQLPWAIEATRDGRAKRSSGKCQFLVTKFLPKRYTSVRSPRAIHLMHQGRRLPLSAGPGSDRGQSCCRREGRQGHLRSGCNTHHWRGGRVSPDGAPARRPTG